MANGESVSRFIIEFPFFACSEFEASQSSLGRALLVLNPLMEGGDDAYCQEEEGDMRLSWYPAHADLSKISFK